VPNTKKGLHLANTERS
jgi:hypothetical protein